MHNVSMFFIDPSPCLLRRIYFQRAPQIPAEIWPCQRCLGVRLSGPQPYPMTRYQILSRSLIQLHLDHSRLVLTVKHLWQYRLLKMLPVQNRAVPNQKQNSSENAVTLC